MQRYIARQPIFDEKLNVVAYELLFRSDLDNYCKSTDTTQASTSVISDSLSTFEFGQLTDGKRAFINVGRESLLSGVASLLPPDHVAIELLESVEADDAVVDACRRLVGDGYRIALDDYVDRPEMRPLLDLAHYVKIDVLATPEDALPALVARLHRQAPKVRLLAEKVETREVFARCARLGFSLYQGYFFARPTIVAGSEIPGAKLNYLRLLREIAESTYDIGRVEQILKADVAISYKLLRYVNSAAFGVRNRVSSLREAIVLLGQSNIRKLAALWAMAGLGKDAPQELLSISVTRARFCEEFAAVTGMAPNQSELFLLGMFSVIDVMVGRSMTDIVAQLPVSEEVRAGLADATGPLRPVLDCVIAYERGDWATVEAFAAAHGIDADTIPALYVDALAITSLLTSASPAPSSESPA
jgi:c-di-GMP-related signal transduction protein